MGRSKKLEATHNLAPHNKGKTMNTHSGGMLVSKFVEIIGGKTLSSPRGYNYDEHNEDQEGEYYSYPKDDPRGNAIFLIPAHSTYQVDEFQNIIVSKKIKFVRWK